MSDSYDREFVRAVKDAKKMRRQQSMSGVLKALGNAFPKGIRNPDDTVRNSHLYIPGKGSHKTRLF